MPSLPRLVLLVTALIGLLVAADVAAAAPKPCTAKQVARTVNGKRTCVPATTQRAVVPKRSVLLEGVADLLGPEPIPLALRRKLGDGPKALPSVPPANLTRATQSTAAELEAALLGAIDGAGSAGRRSLLGTPVIERGPVDARQNADGSVTASAKGTLRDGGKVTEVGLEMTADKNGGLDSFGLDVAYTENGKRSQFGIKAGGKSTIPACPTADGKIQGSLTYEFKLQTGEKQKVAGVNIGQWSKNVSTKGRLTISAELGRDATLTRILYDVKESFQLAHGGSALGFVQRNWVANVNVTGKGMLDPKTGQPLAGSRSTVETKATSASFSASELAAAKAALAGIGDKMLKSVLGAVMDEVRDVEKNAQTPGKCVKIELDPAPTWKLAAGSTLPVKATLKTTEGGATVSQVDWTASASLGSIAPGTSAAETPTFTITGAGPSGGETARTSFKATSVAGVADTTGVAKDDPFPPAIEGTLAVTQDFVSQTKQDWSATARYVKATDTTHPDGSRTVIYNLATAGVSSALYRQTPYGLCEKAEGTLTGGAGTVVAGDVEFIVDASGTATVKILYDVAAPTFIVAPVNCTIPPPPPPSFPVTSFKAFLNTGLQPFTAFPLAATNLPLAGLLPLIGTGTMSWQLLPAS